MINSMFFEFGNSEGQYPINGYLTDSIFTVVQVTGIAYGSQYYSTEITQGQRSLNYANLFEPTAGDKVRIDFLNPLIMQNA